MLHCPIPVCMKGPQTYFPRMKSTTLHFQWKRKQREREKVIGKKREWQIEKERESEKDRERDGWKFSSMKYTYKQRGYVGLQIDFIYRRGGGRGIKFAQMQNFANPPLFVQIQPILSLITNATPSTTKFCIITVEKFMLISEFYRT